MKPATGSALAAAALVLTTAAHAEWVAIASGTRSTFYLDPASLKIDGSLRRAWLITDLRTAVGSIRSARRLDEVDCAGERSRSLQITQHTGPMGTGELVNALTEPTPWQYVPPDTIYRRAMSAICSSTR